MGIHVVKQGEHLSGIALLYGFTHHSRLWDDPGNQELKASRKNPHVLYPGDEVYIPDSATRDEDCSTDKLHKFKVHRDRLHLWLKLEKLYHQPIANTNCELIVDLNRYPLTTDGQGVLHHPIAATSVDATLLVKDTVTSKGKELPLEREFNLRIGHLDPVEEVSGQQARLANLGYYRGPLEPLDEDEFLSATEEFQLEHGLSVDGICGPNTQAKLKSVHGI